MTFLKLTGLTEAMMGLVVSDDGVVSGWCWAGGPYKNGRSRWRTGLRALMSICMSADMIGVQVSQFRWRLMECKSIGLLGRRFEQERLSAFSTNVGGLRWLGPASCNML